MRFVLACAAIGALLVAAPPAFAQDASRPFNPIARPTRPALPLGAQRLPVALPVSRPRIESAVGKVMAAWNDRNLDRVLAQDYQRRDELKDSLQTKVPRDAKLRIVAIQGYQVLDQYLLAGVTVTKVSVTVRTQLEYNDPVTGFVSLDGTNEYHLTLRGDPR